MNQALAAIFLFLPGNILALGKTDQHRPAGKEFLTTKAAAIGIWKENWEDIPAVEISLRLEGRQLAGSTVFYAVGPEADEVVK